MKIYDIESSLQTYNKDIELEIMHIGSNCNAMVLYKGLYVGKILNDDAGFRYISNISDYIIYDVKDSMHPLKCNYRKPGSFSQSVIELLNNDIKIVEHKMDKMKYKSNFVKELINICNKYELALKIEDVECKFSIDIKTEDDIRNLEELLED